MLSRNVKIVGDPSNTWGAQVVTGDMIEIVMDSNGIPVFENGKPKMNGGAQTNMDSVEISHCSQQDTDKAALRWDIAAMASSMVSNCAIHDGLGKGTLIRNSKNVVLKSNVWFSFQAHGV